MSARPGIGSLFGLARPSDVSMAVLVKACVGLVLGALIVSACGSTAAPATTVPQPSATAIATAASVAPSVVPSIPAAMAVTSTITPTATIAVPNVGGILSDGTTLWVFMTSGQFARLDPATDTIGASLTVDPTWQGGGVAVSSAGLWVADFNDNLLYRADPTSGKIVAKIAVGPNPEGVAVGDGAVWVADHRGGTVERVDPATNTVVGTIKVGRTGSSGPHQVGVGLGSVWVGVPNASAVFRIDPATNTVVASIDVRWPASPCSGFAFDTQAVWMPSCQDSTILSRIDPVTNKVVASIDLLGYGDDPIFIDGKLWLVVESTKGLPARLERIDQSLNTVDRVISLGDGFKGANLLVADGSVWATDWVNNQILRLPLEAFKT